VKRIGERYRVESELCGLNPEARLAGRQERSARLIANIHAWLELPSIGAVANAFLRLANPP
jgi:hypothetical protein